MRNVEERVLDRNQIQGTFAHPSHSCPPEAGAVRTKELRIAKCRMRNVEERVLDRNLIRRTFPHPCHSCPPAAGAVRAKELRIAKCRIRNVKERVTDRNRVRKIRTPVSDSRLPQPPYKQNPAAWWDWWQRGKFIDEKDSGKPLDCGSSECPRPSTTRMETIVSRLPGDDRENEGEIPVRSLGQIRLVVRPRLSKTSPDII